MRKPKYLYEIEPQETLAHAMGAGCITVQQKDLLDGDAPDRLIYLSRADAAKLRDALGQWLSETE